MTQVGDQWALSYMDGSQLAVRIADSPGDFATASVQHVDLEHTGYPNPPGFGAAYGGYILPNSTPDDLRFAVSYYGDKRSDEYDPYGVGEWRYRPQ